MMKRMFSAALLAAAGLAGCSHPGKAPEIAEAGHSLTTGPANADVFSDSFWRDPAAQADDPPMMQAKAFRDLKRVFPAQASKDGTITYCGELLYGENNRHATDAKTVGYAMRLDCDSNGKVDEADGIHTTAFAGVKPAQKGHMTRWRQMAAQKHGSSGVPFICFKGQAQVDPCSGKTATVVNASFTSKTQVVLDALNAAKKQ